MWFNRWASNYSGITVAVISDFLLFLFNSNTSLDWLYSADALNTFFLKLELPDFRYNPLITSLFKYFYKVRPSFPKYVVTWDVGRVLRYLAGWHPPSSLTLKQLTLKTVALVALTASDRSQTLQALRVDRVSSTPQGLEFVVFDVLKTTRKGRPARVVKCVSWDAPELDVAAYVLKYIEITSPFRSRAQIKGLRNPNQPFLSHKTGLPVARATISRWIKDIMSLSGVDTSMFSPGSTRGASVSAAARRGASLDQILGAGDWSNLGTYQRFYQRQVDDTPVGCLILEEATVSVPYFLVYPYSLFIYMYIYILNSI